MTVRYYNDRLLEQIYRNSLENSMVVATVAEEPGLNARQQHSYLQSVRLLHIVTPYATGKL